MMISCSSEAVPLVSLLSFLYGIGNQIEQHFHSVVAALAILSRGFPILGIDPV